MSSSAARLDVRRDGSTSKRRLVLLLCCAALVAAPASASAQALAGSVKHTMRVTLDAATHRLTVTDTVHVAHVPADRRVEFVLNGALRITTSKPPVTEVPLGHTRFFGISGTSETLPGVALKRYRVALPPSGGVGADSFTLNYGGTVDFGLSDQKEEYTRGFRETAGIVGPQGVYLAGSGFWYPSFNQELLEFTLDVTEPPGWHVVSEGNGTSRDTDGHARWDSGGPMDEIHLVGGPLQVFRDSAGPVETLVYLHDRDDAVAAKYLSATAQYLELYRQLIGPYPYRKFALVENFWETGYGMPTFTLLGREIIRFPFIVSSSYPHEILHNWWGNSVFVAENGGNWCEGLTAYMADYLIQEQHGAGADYRRSTLQKYRDYVKAGRDFPLTTFSVRSSAATEAVGYGKALMLFHMLRQSMGDDAFRKTAARFYRDFRGKRASFTDFEHVAEAVSGQDYSRLFTEQVTLAGAAELAVTLDSVKPAPDGFVVSARLRQSQAGSPLALDVPVILQTARGIERDVVRLDGREQTFTIASRDAPIALHVDPYFDVFRKLDPRETAPSIGQIFGEPRVLALLPSAASAAELDAWRALFSAWQSGSHAIEVKLDRDVTALPRDRAVWVAGRANRWADRLFAKLPGMVVTATDVQVEQQKMPLGNHTLVAVVRHPENAEKAVGWLVVDPADAFPGLGRKLPHYGKYSYLGFEGAEPVNVLTGQWQESDSPLRVDLRAKTADLKSATADIPVPPLPPDHRKALAELPPIFSRKALVEHVTWLADPAREGRGLGSAGERAAAAYIADRFKAYGLQPLGPSDTGERAWLQSFTAAVGDEHEMKPVANVIGVIPGTKPEWKDQAVLVTAHDDHLGLGWPDVHKGDEGKIHPGADDNASGIAVMLELARVLAGEDKPSRSIVFVAFTGEEAGLLGSKYYVEHPGRFPLSKTIGVINLDTVGRLGDQKISILGTGTASEWQHIFMGASFVTGIESRNIPESIQASDQVSFIRSGVPAVQIFTGAHADYHRPTDTADKIDGAGLVKVATLVREAVSYLAERPDPMTNTIPKMAPTPGGAPPSTPAPGGAAAPASGRRVSFGTVPDFAFEGPGVRVGGLVPGSPAANAGVQVGDIIKAIDGRPVANLQAFSDLLRTFAPGQLIKATMQRGDRELTLEVRLAER